MAFAVTDRVRVSSENSQFRNRLGVIMDIDADGNRVRLDGWPKAGKTELFRDEELQTSTQAVPVDYT